MKNHVPTTSLPCVDLFDEKSVRVDESGRSIGFFCNFGPTLVGGETLESLKKAAGHYPDKNVRLCLHDSPGASFHSMIIYERNGTYYPPHSHPKKGESWHVLEGELAVAVFSETGDILDAQRLDPLRRFIYRIEPSLIHTVFALTPHVIYHESKPGPFVREGDSVVPDWAPPHEDDSGRAALIERVLNALPTQQVP